MEFTTSLIPPRSLLRSNKWNILPKLSIKAQNNFFKCRKYFIYLLQNELFFAKILVYIMGENLFSDFLLGYDWAVTGYGQNKSQ